MVKTVLVSGSTSGIGLAIAKVFAKRSYNIVLNGLHEDGHRIAEEMSSSFNVKAIFSPANLLIVAEIEELVSMATLAFGRIDVLVNNAGIQYVAPIEEFPGDKWDEIIALNLTAAFHLTKNIWPMMKKNNFGRIINIASAHGLVGSPFKSAYVAAKHGLVGFTKTAALEGAAYGINVNAICPGFTMTALVERQILEAMHSQNKTREDVINDLIMTKHIIPDFVKLDAIAETALFLAESPASDSITGICLPVDCGWTSH